MRILLLFILASGIWLNAQRADAFATCETPNYLAAFNLVLPPEPCTVIAQFPVVTAGGTSQLRLMRLTNTEHGDDSVWVAHTELLAIALGSAIDAIGTARLPPEITVLLTNTERVIGDLQVHAVTAGLVPSIAPDGSLLEIECAVPFYKLPGGAELEDFLVAVSHEVFHCAQRVSWPAAYAGSSPHWWREGSAEYFSELVAPGNHRRDGWIDAFERRSLAESVLDMRYENLVLFLWIGDRGGPAAVGTFLDGMAAGDQLAVLRSMVPLSDWRAFVEAYLDGEIHRPGVGIVPVPSQVNGERSFRRSGDMALGAEDYVIRRWWINFADEKLFRLSLAVTSGAPEIAMRIDGEPGTWAPPPEQVNTCESEKSYLVYAVSTDSPGGATLTVETDEDTTGGACCLVGNWAPTEAALNGLATFGTTVAGQVCGYAGGGWQLSFRGDGTGDIAYSDFTNFCKSASSPMRVDNILNGSTDFSWAISGAGAAELTFTGHSMTQSMQLTVGDHVQDLSGNYPGPSTRATGMAYTCSGNSLSVIGMFNLFVEQADHSRLIAVP